MLKVSFLARQSDSKHYFDNIPQGQVIDFYCLKLGTNETIVLCKLMGFWLSSLKNCPLGLTFRLVRYHKFDNKYDHFAMIFLLLWRKFKFTRWRKAFLQNNIDITPQCSILFIKTFSFGVPGGVLNAQSSLPLKNISNNIWRYFSVVRISSLVLKMCSNCILKTLRALLCVGKLRALLLKGRHP